MAVIQLEIDVPNVSSSYDLALLKEKLTTVANLLLPEMQKRKSMVRLSDSQLEAALCRESSFDEARYKELSDEEFQQLCRGVNPVVKGVEKWL